MDPDHGISRLDQESVGTHGWQVRLQRKGVRYGRFFSDSAWGGKENALNIARQYRDKVMEHSERLPGGAKVSSRSHTSPTSRSSSGVVGVTRIVQTGANGVEYRFWQASWTTADGVREIVRYSVLKYGNDAAFEKAVRARRRAMG
ncbi:MAG: hypothetical protein MI807_05130 [Verrucomicrobiales bacterium]|nr:hypothetical protein [Verrucomicrobiales bacterium]